MRICIVRLSALGDIVMCLPLIKTLQKNFPDSKITWIVGKPFYPLVEDIEGIEIIPMPKIKSVKDWFKVRKLLQNQEYDILLGIQASMSAHLIYPLIKAKRKIGYDALRSKDFHGFFVDERIGFHKEHTVDGFLRFAKQIGAKEICYKSSELLSAKRATIERPYFVINPCSSKREKDWDYENYLPVIRSVKEKYGLTPVLTGGASDKAVCAAIENELDGCINMCGKTSLKELSAILKDAKFLLSPDTGPAHIASAIGTPVIGLFAPTSSLITGPYFSKEGMIDKHSEVLLRFATKKEQSLGWNVRIYHKDAMALITVDEVLQKIDTFLSTGQSSVSHNAIQ